MKPSSLIIARQHGDRTASTINKIISCVLGYKKILLDSGVWLIDEDVTIPPNISLEILPDAVISISVGMTLTVNSDSFIVHRTDWYAGAGAVAGAYTGGRLVGTAASAARLLEEGISTGLEMDGEKVAVSLSSILSDDVDKAATPKLVSDTFETFASFSPLVYAGGESIEFPNGLVLKHGFHVDVDQADHTESITFGSAFDNAIISVSVVPQCTASDISDFHVVGAPSISGFDVRHIIGDTLEGWHWQAWGY